MLIQGVITDPQHVHSGVGYYGLSLRNSLATFVHPNELFDGAVTVDTTRSGRGYYPTTWDWQNHPLVLELYAAHGRSLNFAGVVLQRIRFETNHGKEVGAQNAARLAKAMGAERRAGDLDRRRQRLCRRDVHRARLRTSGIKTTLVTYENGGKEGKDSPVLFYLSEADAVVSTGSARSPGRIAGHGQSDRTVRADQNFSISRRRAGARARRIVVGSARRDDRRRGYLGPGIVEMRGVLS